MANFCKYCGANLQASSKFCPKCGAQVIHFVPAPIQPSKKKKKLWIPLVAGILILALLFTMIRYLVIPYLPMGFDDTPITFDPEPLAISGSSEFSITPLPGVTISAEKNALDRNRTFTVERLDDSQIQAMAKDMHVSTFVPLAGIDIDSGMEARDIFPGALSLTMDLVEFNIPESMYAHLSAYRIEDDGSTYRLPSSVMDGSLFIETERNCKIILGLSSHFWIALAVGLTVVLPAIAVTHDTLQKEGYIHDDWSLDTDLMSTGWLDIDDVNGYTIYYPARMAPGNPAEVKRVTSLLIQALENNKIQVTANNIKLLMENPSGMKALWTQLQKDTDFLEAQKLLDDKQWRMSNLYPGEVAALAAQLTLADKYLFNSPENEGRGFKKYNDMHIIAYDKWPGEASNQAQCRNPISKQPYVMVNIESAPLLRSSAMKSWTDTMLPTLVHELFHTSQVRYLGTFSMEREKDTWFFEATAVAVEKQARDFFEQEKIIAPDKMVISQQNINYCQENLAYANGYNDVISLQNQGYAYALLIEYISHQYATSTGKSANDYLPYALQKYAELRDSRQTLVKTTSKSNYSFETLYHEFCTSYGQEFLSGYHLISNPSPALPSPVSLTATQPFTSLTKDYESLSADVRRLVVSDAASQQDKSVKFVLRGKTDALIGLAEGFGLNTLSVENGSVKSKRLHQPNDLSSPSFDLDLGLASTANKYSLYLQGVNYNYDKDIHREYDVFAMYSPNIPGMDFNKITDTMWNLRIHLEESVLYQQGYVDAYKVSIRCPNGDIYTFETEETDLELNTSYDKQALNESIYANDAIYNIEHTKATSQSTITGNFDMFYNELTSTDTKVMGPKSPVVSLKVAERVDLTANTDTLGIGEEISYTVDVIPDKGNYSYRWIISDRIDQEGGREFQISFDEPGSYTAQVIVSDQDGNLVGSDTWTCTVLDVTAPGDFNPDLAFFQIYKEDNTPTDYVYTFVEGYVVEGRYDQVQMYYEDGIYLDKYYISFGTYDYDSRTQTYHGDMKEHGSFTGVVNNNWITLYHADGSFLASAVMLNEDRPFEYRSSQSSVPSFNYDSVIPEGD
jgi:hypothetical protein